MSRYRPPQPRGSKFITPRGAQKLKDELDHLWRVLRPQVTLAVQEAAAQGDRSENAEYIYGKRQLREIALPSLEPSAPIKVEIALGRRLAGQ